MTAIQFLWINPNIALVKLTNEELLFTVAIDVSKTG